MAIFPENLTTSDIVIIVIVALIMGYVNRRYAARKGYGPIWFLIGFFFGMFALLTLHLLPNKKILQQLQNPPAPAKPYFHPFSQVQWFYLNTSHEQIGPLSFEQLTKTWQEKVTNEKTYVWSENLSQWEFIENLPELQTELSR